MLAQVLQLHYLQWQQQQQGYHYWLRVCHHLVWCAELLSRLGKAFVRGAAVWCLELPRWGALGNMKPLQSLLGVFRIIGVRVFGWCL
jgi:hypothetical protein